MDDFDQGWKYMPLLQAQCLDYRQNPFHETVAVCAVAAPGPKGSKAVDRCQADADGDEDPWRRVAWAFGPQTPGDALSRWPQCVCDLGLKFMRFGDLGPWAGE